MSQQIQCTAPLNIVRRLQTDNICKLKCAYQFKYAHTNLTIHNYGSMLLFFTQASSTPPVVYNDQNYNLYAAVLVSPSMHTYNGSRAHAELILAHMSTSAPQKNLYVCIPIKASSNTSDDSATYLDMILSTIAQSGTTAVYNDSTFTFNKFVPMKPFFSYTGTDMFNTACYSRNGVPTSQIDYIVFNNDNAITMSRKAFTIIRQLLAKTPPRIAPINQSVNPTGLFYNPDGPSSSREGEIYIDCRPTGDEGEVLVPASVDSSSLLDGLSMTKMMNFTFIKIVIGIILMMLLWKMMIKVVKGITGSSTKMPGVGGSFLK